MTPRPPPFMGATQCLVQTTLFARRKWNNVQCDVEAGVTYFFSATGEWWDLTNNCTATGYDRGYLNFAKRYMRCQLEGATWFTLIGALDEKKEEMFVIGDGSRLQLGWRAPRQGRLYAFANDMPGMYWNNFGSITLEVWR